LDFPAVITVPAGIALNRLTFETGREESWTSLLSEEESARLAGMKHEKRRRSFLLGRAALRLLLSELVDAPPAGIRVVVEDNGSLAAPETPFIISIAHSGGRAVAAASREPVGIDIEISSEKDEDLLPYILHDDELSRLRSLLISDREKLFLCWTAKEAVLKALGTGLRKSPKSVQLGHIDDHLRYVVVSDVEGSSWHVRIERDGEYYLSLATPYHE
jgi:4'-phosphopantetheinyl transferase